MSKHVKKIDALIIFALGLLLFTIGTYHQEFIAFEIRFALFAKEMLANGLTWFPTTYQHAYPDYPVTPTFLIYLSSKLLGGHLSKLSAVLPTAIASSLSLVFIYLIGALQQRRWGWFAVLLCLLTNTFIVEARTISIDQYVCAITAAAFYVLYSRELSQKKTFSYWIPFLFTLGFLMRGPIGLVLPASVVCIYYLVSREYRSFIIYAMTAACVLILLSVILLFIAWHVGQMALLKTVINAEVLGRITTSAHPPWYFYLQSNLSDYSLSYLFALLTLFGLIIYYKKITPAQRRLLLLTGSWLIVIILGMSLAGDKKSRYILAISPALALLASYPLSFAETRYFLFLRRFLLSLCFLLPWLILAGFIFAVHFDRTHNYHVSINLVLISVLLISAVCLSLLGLFLSRHKLRYFILLSATIISVMTTVIFIYTPANLAINQQRSFVIKVEQERIQEKADLVFYRLESDSTALLYMVNTPENPKAYFITKPKQILNYPRKAIFITQENYFKALPASIQNQMNIIARNCNLHHYTIIAFVRQ